MGAMIFLMVGKLVQMMAFQFSFENVFVFYQVDFHLLLEVVTWDLVLLFLMIFVSQADFHQLLAVVIRDQVLNSYLIIFIFPFIPLLLQKVITKAELFFISQVIIIYLVIFLQHQAVGVVVQVFLLKYLNLFLFVNN